MMSKNPSSEQFRLDLLAVVETGASLLKHLAVQPGQPLPSPAEITTVEDARAAGVLAAVKALNAHIGRLCGPRQSPTLDHAERALSALRQQRDVQTAFHAAYSQVLIEVCLQLEDVLDRQELREKEADSQGTKEP